MEAKNEDGERKNKEKVEEGRNMVLTAHLRKAEMLAFTLFIFEFASFNGELSDSEFRIKELKNGKV